MTISRHHHNVPYQFRSAEGGGWTAGTPVVEGFRGCSKAPRRLRELQGANALLAVTAWLRLSPRSAHPPGRDVRSLKVT